MREFKFRAWDGRSIIGDLTLKTTEGIEIKVCSFPDYIFMQYTGLKDKNGEEIYDEDIIKDSFGDRIGVVKFNEYEASYELTEYDGIHIFTAYNCENLFEVIGNIYEHQHLLKENEGNGQRKNL